MTKPDVVRFLFDDPYGLWHADDLADDLGWESDHPDAPPIRLLRLHRHGRDDLAHEPRRAQTDRIRRDAL
jgi:hypothetical protein